jgi:eukaryotic-like serine/threonine-protein kinase
MNLTSGVQLGPYEIIAPLGAGGMGEVYRARDTRLKREVAIKVLPKALSQDADRLRRFEQEALATAALNHPNILAVFDIGSHEGSPYVVSELLEGETLRDRLRGGSLAQRKALDYAMQIAHGLAAAHEKGIVHRDLKPENLFLTKDGRVKILDFGLAKLTQPDPSSHASLATMTHVTEAGAVMGTAGYMSPEQVRGIAVDPRSDIFSFGAILYEMLSGKRAFHRDTPADTMSAILKEDPQELSETNRNVSPALERIVQHCLEKNPEQRFHSASDIAFDLEHLSGVSGTTSRAGAAAVASSQTGHRKWLVLALIGGLAAAVVLLGLGWWIGKSSVHASQAEYKQITFRTGLIGHARFTPDGGVVYSAAWDGGDTGLYIASGSDPGARELGIKDAELLSISKSGELAVRLHSKFYAGYARTGTLAIVPLSGGTPRELMEDVQDADWAADGEKMAVVRYVAQSNHWRLEYPIGNALFDSINWISHPKISPDGKWVAFADHENPSGDDEGSVAVISADGKGTEKKLSSGWIALEGILWSQAGDEIWFASSDSGSAIDPRAVTLSGKVRSITRVPGGMWIEDLRNGNALMVTHQTRVGIRGLAPGAKEERELGWFGWSNIRDISLDGHKILFEEEGDGGGPNYTLFVRDTDGSPPTRIGEGIAFAISPDTKWAISQPINRGNLNLVPTGAGESRTLTHDSISYGQGHWLPDGKHVLASGIESGHGQRDYLIDISTGDSKPITPEGVFGTRLSPDGRNIAVRGPDGVGIWPLDGGGMRLIPGFDKNLIIFGWSPDGKSVYAVQGLSYNTTSHVYKVDIATGKTEPWKTFGTALGTGVEGVGPPNFSSDGTAYAYAYGRKLSQAYVVSGLK